MVPIFSWQPLRGCLPESNQLLAAACGGRLPNKKGLPDEGLEAEIANTTMLQQHQIFRSEGFLLLLSDCDLFQSCNRHESEGYYKRFKRSLWHKELPNQCVEVQIYGIWTLLGAQH